MPVAPNLKLSFDERFALSRAFIRKKWPYVMSTVYGLVFRPYPDHETMFTTPGMILAANPDFVESLEIDELAACVVHECSHVLRDFFRRVVFMDDPDLFNQAADIPINDSLRAAGWKLPGFALFHETFNLPEGLAGEEYYRLMQKKGMKGKNKSGPGQGSGVPGKGPPGARGKGQPQHGVCGGSCGAPSQDIAKALDAKGGRSDADKKRIIRQTLEEVKKFADRKGRGSVPGMFQDLITEMDIVSRIEWRSRLQDIVRHTTGIILSGGDDFSLRHPSKRSYTRRLLRPGLIDQQMTPFFIIDTSGSMSMQQMLEALAEAIAVLEQLGIDMGWLCLVDAGVAMEPRLMTLAELRGMTHFAGRGGTDFRPGFAAAKKTYPRPDLVMYFTDGDGWAPRTPPQEFETIWCVVPRSHYARRPAKWGHVVIISDDPKQPNEENMAAPYLPPPEPGEEVDADEGLDDDEL